MNILDGESAELLYQHFNYQPPRRLPITDYRDFYWIVEDVYLYLYESIKDWGNNKQLRMDFVVDGAPSPESLKPIKRPGTRLIFITDELTAMFMVQNETNRCTFAILDNHKRLKPI